MKDRKHKEASFTDWWFEKDGEMLADAEYGKQITKALLKQMPSYPNEANAYSEALWSIAFTDNAHLKLCRI